MRTAADAHESLRKVLGYAHANIVEAACAHVPVASAMVDEDDLIRDGAVRDVIASSLAELVSVAEPPPL